MGRRFSVEIDIKVIVLQLTVLIISYIKKKCTTAMTTLAQLLISCIQEKEREIPLLHL